MSRQQGVEKIRHCHKGFNTPSCDLETTMRPVFLLGVLRRLLLGNLVLKYVITGFNGILSKESAFVLFVCFIGKN